MSRKEIEDYSGSVAYSALMTELTTDSDRAAVILGAAEIEARLQFLLIAVLRTNSDLRKDLFNFNGALGSLSARIKMCYAMRVIDRQLYKCLEDYRSLRNDIVHNGKDVNLDSEIIREDLDNFLAPFRDSEWLCGRMYEFEHLNDTQRMFRYAIGHACITIEVATAKCADIPEEGISLRLG